MLVFIKKKNATLYFWLLLNVLARKIFSIPFLAFVLFQKLPHLTLLIGKAYSIRDAGRHIRTQYLLFSPSLFIFLFFHFSLSSTFSSLCLHFYSSLFRPLFFFSRRPAHLSLQNFFSYSFCRCLERTLSLSLLLTRSSPIGRRIVRALALFHFPVIRGVLLCRESVKMCE